MDLRGHGDSPNDRSLRTTRIKHYVEDLATAIDRFDAPPILVGHSMGGLVVQKYLETHEVPGAVLLAPVPIGGVTRATLRVARRHPWKFIKANLTWSLGPLVENPSIAADLFLPSDATQADVGWLGSRLQSESYVAYLDMMLFVRARPQLVNSPVAIIAADDDRIFGVGELRKAAGAYGVELQVLDAAAHDLMLGPRWETAAAKVEEAAGGFA